MAGSGQAVTQEVAILYRCTTELEGQCFGIAGYGKQLEDSVVDDTSDLAEEVCKVARERLCEPAGRMLDAAADRGLVWIRQQIADHSQISYFAEEHGWAARNCPDNPVDLIKRLVNLVRSVVRFGYEMVDAATGFSPEMDAVVTSWVEDDLLTAFDPLVSDDGTGVLDDLLKRLEEAGYTDEPPKEISAAVFSAEEHLRVCGVWNHMQWLRQVVQELLEMPEGDRPDFSEYYGVTQIATNAELQEVDALCEELGQSLRAAAEEDPELGLLIAADDAGTRLRGNKLARRLVEMRVGKLPNDA